MDFRYTLPRTEGYCSEPRCGRAAAAEVSMRGRAAATAEEPNIEWHPRRWRRPAWSSGIESGGEETGRDLEF
jgi:hypothetical protein